MRTWKIEVKRLPRRGTAATTRPARAGSAWSLGVATPATLIGAEAIATIVTLTLGDQDLSSTISGYSSDRTIGWT